MEWEYNKKLKKKTRTEKQMQLKAIETKTSCFQTTTTFEPHLSGINNFSA